MSLKYSFHDQPYCFSIEFVMLDLTTILWAHAGYEMLGCQQAIKLRLIKIIVGTERSKKNYYSFTFFSQMYILPKFCMPFLYFFLLGNLKLTNPFPVYNNIWHEYKMFFYVLFFQLFFASTHKNHQPVALEIATALWFHPLAPGDKNTLDLYHN